MSTTGPNPTRKQQREAARQARLEAEKAAAARAARKRRLIQLGGLLAVAAAIVIGVIALTGNGESETATVGDATDITPVAESPLRGIPQRGISLGAANAPVVLVEFADFQCPFCAQYANSTLPDLIRDYVATGRVRMELRTMAFIGEDSVEAARAGAGAAEQNRLWNFAEVFFANQGTEQTGYVTPGFLNGVFRAAGVDAAQANAYAAREVSRQPIAEADALARRYGIESTPSFLIGRRGGGLATLEAGTTDTAAFRRAIDGLLNR